jgi:hypothetical protein
MHHVTARPISLRQQQPGNSHVAYMLQASHTASLCKRSSTLAEKHAESSYPCMQGCARMQGYSLCGLQFGFLVHQLHHVGHGIPVTASLLSLSLSTASGSWCIGQRILSYNVAFRSCKLQVASHVRCATSLKVTNASSASILRTGSLQHGRSTQRSAIC